MNIFNLLYNPFIWNNDINILDSKLRTGTYAGYIAVTPPFLVLEDWGKNTLIYTNTAYLCVTEQTGVTVTL
jgi:hypothetical protein